MHNGKICSKCGIEMRVIRNGVIAVEMAIHGPEAAWMVDEWGCPECGATVLLGWAKNPIASCERSNSPAQIEAVVQQYKAAGDKIVRFFVNANERDRCEWRPEDANHAVD